VLIPLTEAKIKVSAMSIKQTIASAGKNLHTIIITAQEEDGSVETREAEPYSYRFKGGHELFFCYDIAKQGTRSLVVARIISIEETDHLFVPRWPVEV
jgi:predicted DNA-binding transcriptional regulator YafY